MKKKRDTGIARLNNDYPILEETRDRLRKLIDKDGNPTYTQTDFSPDNATTRDLEVKRWSGFRLNMFTQDIELWCVGRILVKRPLQMVEGNPNVMADMHEEAFQTLGTVLEIPISDGLKAIGAASGTTGKKH